MKKVFTAIVVLFLAASLMGGAMFSEARAARAVKFFESLKHTKGRFYGQAFGLLPWQKSIVRDVYGTVNESGYRTIKYVYIEVPKKNGKALAINTRIPTPEGWMELGDLQIGDQVFDELGQACNIVAATEAMKGRPCYQIQFTNGQTIVADADHQWLTTTRRPEARTAIRTTAQISASIESLNGLNHRIQLARAITVPERILPLDPYLLGLWLGDGNSRDARITIADPEPLAHLRGLGYKIEHRDSFGDYGYWVRGINPILRDLGLFKNKHIPEMYLFSSAEQRFELLRGLMDSDGYCSKAGQCEFCNIKKRLANGVATLTRSLGFKTTITTGRASLNGRDCGEKYRVLFHPNADVPVFRIQRKLERQSVSAGKDSRASRIYIKACVPVESVLVRCIQVDSPSSLYLASESFIPTHNSEICAGAGLFHLFADREKNGEVYGCAADKEQASLVFDVAVDMIDQQPVLAKRAKLNLSTKMITDRVSGTFYKVVSAEAYTKHGLNLSACIFDELHAQPNRELWDVMTFGSGDARTQPIWWIITTAGDDPDRVSICWEQHEYALKLLAGDVIDPTWYPVIYGYPGEDIYNEEHWAASNPSLGETITLDSVQEAASKAKVRPADERLFRWLRLNQWITTKLTTWLPIDLFDATVGEWERDEQLGKECYIGLDLSTTTDLSAIAVVFPPQGTQYDWRVFWQCWIPADNMQERIEKDHVPYDQWAAGGWLTPTPGNVIDYTKIHETIQEVKKFYKVIEVDADRAFATMLIQVLEQDGLVCVDVPQTFVSLTDPLNQTEILLKGVKEIPSETKPLAGALLTGRMTHENNPVARWCFGNTSIAKNGQGFIKFVKEHKGKSVVRTKRIDLTAAWINAMARARFYKGSVDLSAEILKDDWGM